MPDLSGGGVGGFCVPNAQHASRQALVLAKNILAARRGEPLTDYYHETIGVVAGLGLWKGVANFKGKTFAGPLAMDYAPRLPRFCNPHDRAYRPRL